MPPRKVCLISYRLFRVSRLDTLLTRLNARLSAVLNPRLEA